MEKIKKKMLQNIFGIISGIISIIYAFIIKTMENGDVVNTITYGGDAYTGMQNAGAQTANNIFHLNEMIQTGLFAFFLIFGIALICFFYSQFKNQNKN